MIRSLHLAAVLAAIVAVTAGSNDTLAQSSFAPVPRAQLSEPGLPDPMPWVQSTGRPVHKVEDQRSPGQQPPAKRAPELRRDRDKPEIAPPAKGREADSLRSDGSGPDSIRPDRRGNQPAQRQAAPKAPETPASRCKALDDLYAMLAAAGSEPEAATIAQSIEQRWTQSDSDTVSLLMARATQAVAMRNPALSIELLGAVADLAPDFAEAFARRAFLFYTESDSTRALGDLRRALALEPNHFRALDGLATILLEIGEKRAALKALKQLESVHPFWPGLEERLRETERAVEGQGI